MKQLLFLVIVLLGSQVFAQNVSHTNREPDSTSTKVGDSSIPLPHIYVYGERAVSGAKSTQMSAISLPAMQVKVMPKIFGETDVLKVLQMLPGVQSTGDGKAGIYVRGGNYDQNLITLDGGTLYHAEHLKGFVSAINADIIDNVVLYKGAFPARYGARLSSIVDIGIKDGDFDKFKGSIGIGVLSSRLQLEGPISRGNTSFNIGARASYTKLIVTPFLEKIYDQPQSLRAYANMDYYDISAKLVHKFSNRDKISAFFYKGNDVNDSAPTDSKSSSSNAYADPSEQIMQNKSISNATECNWGNIVSSIFWRHEKDQGVSINTNFSFSRYDYMLKMSSKIDETQIAPLYNDTISQYKEDSYVKYNSEINDYSIASEFIFKTHEKHNLRGGLKFSWQQFGPLVDVYKDAFKKVRTGNSYTIFPQYIDTVLGHNYNLQTLSLYAEDDFDLSEKWRTNIGLRYTLYIVKGKIYHSIEPRLNVRYLLNEDMSFKASYSRMGQGLHLLSSSNLVMPSDVWVPITKDIPLMTSNQVALGYNYNITNGIYASVEGYYKTMDNVLEYAEGSSYTGMHGDWQKMVVLGKGRAYGLEILLEKRTGATTGWIGYTLAKSLRKFDSSEGVINGGKEFYAGNDKRHNLNVVFSHQFNKHWRISANWTFQSGRRGTITTKGIYGGKPEEYDPYRYPFSGDLYKGQSEYISSAFDKPIHFMKYLRYYTPKERNGYILPYIHRLDLSINFTAFVGIGDLDISLDVYNVYNRMNISSVYLGYHENQPVLKGVCMFPIMPSLNIALTF